MVYLLCKWQPLIYLISIFTTLLLNNLILHFSAENIFKVNELVNFLCSTNFIMVNFWFIHVVFVYLIVFTSLAILFKLLYW